MDIISIIGGLNFFTGKTFFKSRDGLSRFSTLNGKYVTMETGDLPAPIISAMAVPGAPSSSPDVLFTGTNYKGKKCGGWGTYLLYFYFWLSLTLEYVVKNEPMRFYWAKQSFTLIFTHTHPSISV